MKNSEIKTQMKKLNLRQWEVADGLGVAESTFTRWLRRELPEARKTLVIEAINVLAKAKQLEDGNGGVDV